MGRGPRLQVVDQIHRGRTFAELFAQRRWRARTTPQRKANRETGASPVRRVRHPAHTPRFQSRRRSRRLSSRHQAPPEDLLKKEREAASAQRTWLDRQRFRPQQWSTSANWRTHELGGAEQWFGFPAVRPIAGRRSRLRNQQRLRELLGERRQDVAVFCSHDVVEFERWSRAIRGDPRRSLDSGRGHRALAPARPS